MDLDTCSEKDKVSTVKKLLFQKTTIRMTGMYLLVLMAVSFLFSISLYRVLGNEIERTYIRAADFANRFGGFRPNPIERAEFMADRLAEKNQSKDKLVGQLVFINVAVLGAGGILSYALARRTLKPIEDAHEALERFTSDASHELRTPLATMRTEIEVALMNKKLTSAEAKKLLESNLEEVERLTHLSERLLLLARLEESGVPLEKMLLSHVLKKAVSVVGPLAEAKKITIRLLDSKAKDVYIYADESSFTELIVILLDNAVKYSGSGTNITIKAAMLHKNVLLEVIDEGVGIAEEDILHIFDRFYRADTSRTGGTGHGYGLGLALAQKIAHLHESDITVTSKKGKGSTFSLELASV